MSDRPDSAQRDARTATETGQPVVRYLIARPAAYRLTSVTPTEVHAVVEADSDRVRGRAVVFPRSQVEALIAFGEGGIVRGRPAWIDELAVARAQVAAQEPEGKKPTTRTKTVKKGKAR